MDDALENRPGSRYGLVLASGLLIATAFGVWTIRTQKAQLRAQHQVQVAQMKAQEAAERKKSQHAVSLLIRSYSAERMVSYSALSDAQAMYAGQMLKSRARVVRTPDAMAISYVSGDKQGFSSGYNGRWFWRQGASGMEPYAEVSREPASTLARRMALLLENYEVQAVKSDKVDGREVEVLEIRPLHSIDGAKGPGKHLSVDAETGLALSTETFDHRWQSVMKSSLSEVNFSPKITPTTFASPKTMSAAAKQKPWAARDLGSNLADVARETGWQPPTPKYLPPGFKFDAVGVHLCGAPGSAKSKGGPLAAMARYTDGLNTLSVFAMPAPKQSAENIAAVCDFGPGTLVSKPAGEAFVIAVADLPEKTLRKVVDETTLQKAR